MRIAQIAPLAEAVPPKLYGGTERVVSWLTEELVRLGHDVTLFATGDSQTAATLVPGTEIGLRLQEVGDHTASNLVMLDNVRRRDRSFLSRAKPLERVGVQRAFISKPVRSSVQPREEKEQTRCVSLRLRLSPRPCRRSSTEGRSAWSRG